MSNTVVAPSTLDFLRPLTSVDVVILSLEGDQLQVLLVKRPEQLDDPFPSMWALPGGFVDVNLDQTLLDCAARKLREKTGAEGAYLEQVGSWGSRNRDPRGWSTTHVYVALLAKDSLHLMPGGNAAELCWAPVSDHGCDFPLAFDHNELLRAAVSRVRNKVEYTSMALHLLPATFTLPEMHRVLEIVSARKLDQKAIRTRFLGADIIEMAEGKKTLYARPAQLYRVKEGHELYYFTRKLGG
jgi:8-oxo-dGTP diphosphatase